MRRERWNLLPLLRAITAAFSLPPKSPGGWRPVINLSCLNRSVLVSPFSYGDRSVGAPVPSSGGLHDVFGPPGRLSSGAGASVFAPLPEVLRGECGLPVLCPLLRPFDSSANVHSSHGPNLLDHASFRLQDPAVFGRLACPRILVPGDCVGKGLSPLVVSGARHPCQPVQELLYSISDHRLSGDEDSDASFEGFPDSQTCPEALLSRSRLRLLLSAASVPLPSVTRGNAVSVVHRPGVLSSDEVPPVTSEHGRSSSPGLRHRVLGRLLPRGSLMVVCPVPASIWSSVRSSSARSLYSPTPRIPGGGPLSRMNICPARGLRPFPHIQSITGNSLRCSTGFRGFCPFCGIGQRLSSRTTPPRCLTCGIREVPIR